MNKSKGPQEHKRQCWRRTQELRSCLKVTYTSDCCASPSENALNRGCSCCTSGNLRGGGQAAFNNEGIVVMRFGFLERHIKAAKVCFRWWAMCHSFGDMLTFIPSFGGTQSLNSRVHT